MNLELQLTSLELSKKLKLLNVKQESLFKWVQDIETGNWKLDVPIFGKHIFNEDISAFTVAELGEMLPEIIKGKDGVISYLEIYRACGNWVIQYKKVGGSITGGLHYEEDSTEANARAEMLIYLLENKLLVL